MKVALQLSAAATKRGPVPWVFSNCRYAFVEKHPPKFLEQ